MTLFLLLTAAFLLSSMYMRLTERDGKVTPELYDGAGVYQLP